ncbi:MAG: trigger factor [Cyclobacteriaceae bacterium]
MEISFDKTNKTQGLIKISVNKADFQPGVDQKIKEYSRTASIKGFRKGKVPAGMIRKMYGTALIVEEINKLVSDKLNSYLREGETQFLGEPLPEKADESFDWENQEVFDFSYQIGYSQPFELKIDKKLKVEKYSIKVDDSVIDETIENLQRQFGEMENPDISSEKDTLYGQATTSDGLLGQEISIDLRDIEKSYLKKLVGIKAETEVQLDARKSFKNENAIKAQVRLNEDDFKKLKKFTFVLKGINHHKLAPVDKALFDKAFGEGNVQDEQEFRLRIKDAVSGNYKSESEKFFEVQLIDRLAEKAKIELPDEFLKKWLVKSNENLTEELLDLEYGTYAKELRWSLIRNKVLKDQEIKVEHEDVTNEAKELIKRQFAGSGLPEMNDQLDTFAQNYLQGENGENYMKVFNQVQSGKVLDFIRGEATIKEKEISLDEFRKL